MPEEDDYETVIVGEMAYRRLKSRKLAEESSHSMDNRSHGKLLITSDLINAPESLEFTERNLQLALHSGNRYFFNTESHPIYIEDILEDYGRLRTSLDTLTMGELWPCVLTEPEHSSIFSVPLDVPPPLAAVLVSELRKQATDQHPFPSAPAEAVQIAAAKRADEFAKSQPYLTPTHLLIALPAENAEAGFVHGANVDVNVRAPFSPLFKPPDNEEPPMARVAVRTKKPNLTVVYTHGRFMSTLTQLGVSTPAAGNLAYGFYCFGIEVNGFSWFQKSLVIVPNQLDVLLELSTKE